MAGSPRKKPELTKAQRERADAADKALRIQVGENITRLRMALGFTQMEFSKHVGIPAPVLNQHENGIYLPSIQYAMKIDKVTKCTLDYIYKGDTLGCPGTLVADMRKIPQGAKKPLT